MADRTVLAQLTAEVVSSYVGNRSLSEAELDHAIDRLPALIGRVHEALLKIVIEGPEGEPAATAEPATKVAEPRQPQLAAPSKTVFDDHLICLEDGLPFKTLKRHLAVHHGMTPEDYRKKWNLPDDYPMAAPDYAASRAAIAKRIGLGASGRGGQPTIMMTKKTPKPRGRPKKS